MKEELFRLAQGEGELEPSLEGCVVTRTQRSWAESNGQM